MVTPTRFVILNVDGHDKGRYALSRQLETAGFEVREAASGAEALRALEGELPDLILLDVQLPDLDGREVCRRIRANPRTAPIPVIHVTATHRTAGDQILGLEDGADAYLREPLEREVLIATIRALLRARRAERKLESLRDELAGQVADLERLHQLTTRVLRTIEAQAGRATLEALMEQVPEGIAIVDAPGSVVRVMSHAGRELMGCRPEGTIHIPEESPLFRAVNRGEVITDEEWILDRPDGRRVSFLCNAGPIRDASGQITGGVMAFRDNTQRRQMEERLREAQRLESVGLLASGVAHDFNNLLTRILGGGSLALDLLDPAHPAADLVREILSAGERGAKLTAQLLAYSGKGRYVVREASLSAITSQFRELLRNSVPVKIDLRFHPQDDLLSARLDAMQIQQLVMSLVMNAAEAIGEDAGTVTVSTGVEIIGAESPAGWAGEAPGPGTWVYLEVCDTGVGMNEATQSRMFDPFFTTKFMGRGLGLSAAQGIVKAHKGALRVRSAPGCGSTFRVLFPAVEGGPTDC